MKTEIIRALPFAEYLARPALNSSTIKTAITHSFAHSQVKKGPTEAMRKGRIYHERLLEPEKNSFYVLPGFSRTTKAGKQEWAEIVESLDGDPDSINEKIKGKKEWVEMAGEILGVNFAKQDDMFIIDEMKKAALNHPDFREMLSAKGEVELSIFHTVTLPDGRTVDIKIRPDKLIEEPDRMVCCDLKSTKDARRYKFIREARYALRYDIQAAFYSQTISEVYGKPCVFRLYPQEKTPPYECGEVIEVSGNVIDAALRQINIALPLWADCLESGNYPGYPSGVHVWDEGDEVY